MGEGQSQRQVQSVVRRGVVGAWLLLCGCGNTLYAVEASAASSRLEEARELGAERLAPYDYYFAKEHLRKAQQEAAEADYSDAIELARKSEAASAHAVEQIKSQKAVQ